jgi:hypothetical protein
MFFQRGTNSTPTITLSMNLFQWRKAQFGRTERKLTVHADNARLHPAKISLDFLEQNGMKSTPPTVLT